MEDIIRMPNKPKTIGIAKLQKLQALAKQARPGSCPFGVVDHRKAPNPYLSRYGDRWEEEIKKNFP